MADLEYLRSALAADSNLCDRVLTAAQQSRDQLQLFVDIARFLTRAHANGISPSDPISKKRKLDNTTNGYTPEAQASSFDPESATAILDLPDVSFTVPVRKKLQVQLLASKSGTADGGGLKVTGKDVSYAIPWSAITQIFCLPVPEKTTRQQNFVVVLDPSTPCQGESQFVFTLSETPYSGQCSLAADQDTWVTLTGRMLNTYLAQLDRGITLPSDNEFSSAVPQAHRKGEAGYHVKAHLGSKDGYLFFLATGIVFGFRKPVQVFPFHAIASISYTSVLQRTFNLVITTQAPTDDPDQESKDVEFAMLDQVDFAGIDEYIKRHELNDSSMAKERMAKRIGVNDPKRRKVDGADQANGEEHDAQADEDEETELQKAEREMQDAEDEEEEDYDPGSEGDSEGEGSDSEGEGGDEAGGDEEVDEVDEAEDEDGEE